MRVVCFSLNQSDKLWKLWAFLSAWFQKVRVNICRKWSMHLKPLLLTISRIWLIENIYHLYILNIKNIGNNYTLFSSYPLYFCHKYIPDIHFQCNLIPVFRLHVSVLSVDGFNPVLLILILHLSGACHPEWKGYQQPWSKVSDSWTFCQVKPSLPPVA